MNTTYWKDKILSDTFINTSNEFYIGLSSTAPAADGSGVTEPGSGLGYGRVRVPSFAYASAGMVKNKGTIVFPVSTGRWFTNSNKASYWVLFDGVGSDANVLTCGNLTDAMEIDAEAQVSIGSGTIKITLSDLPSV